MYSRSFYNEKEEELRPPENYDGNAFKEQTEQLTKAPPEEAQKPAVCASGEPKHGEGGGGFLSSLFSPSGLSGLFGSKGIPLISSLSLPKFGTEEILILASAAYLFFAKDGDRECAILLILLLFVK